jgi:hypothetical protein
MKFKFNQNWGSNKAGTTANVPKQLANMLQGQGIGEIEGGKKEVKPVAKSEVKEVPNETPKSKAKQS